MNTYYVAFLAPALVFTLKDVARMDIEMRLGYPPGSMNPAHMTAKTPVMLDGPGLEALKSRLETLIASRRIAPFTGLLGPIGAFPGTGIVRFAVDGEHVRPAILSVLDALELERSEFDGVTPHITIAEVKPEDAETACAVVRGLDFPEEVEFDQVYVFEQTPYGSRPVLYFNLGQAKAA
jgi:hypothetical protein